MKNITMVTTLFVMGSLALAAPAKSKSQLVVNCSAPKMFAGSSASVQGTLDLTEHPEYPGTPAKEVNGAVAIVIRESANNVILNETRKIRGQYDQVTAPQGRTMEYINAGTLPDGEVSIIMNLRDQDQSMLTFKGRDYPMNCVARKVNSTKSNLAATGVKASGCAQLAGTYSCNNGKKMNVAVQGQQFEIKGLVNGTLNAVTDGKDYTFQGATLNSVCQNNALKIHMSHERGEFDFSLVKNGAVLSVLSMGQTITCK